VETFTSCVLQLAAAKCHAVRSKAALVLSFLHALPALMLQLNNAVWHDFDLAHKPLHNNLETLLLHGLWLWYVAYVCSGLYQSCPHIFNHHAKLELA